MPDATPPTILVVDDDPDIRQSIQWLLEDEGFQVRTAGDGREAVASALRARPDLIVLDMGLPLLTGEEVADALRAALSDPPPIVVITAAGNAAAKAQRCGAVAYLHKPFDLADLADLVQRYARPSAP